MCFLLHSVICVSLCVCGCYCIICQYSLDFVHTYTNTLHIYTQRKTLSHTWHPTKHRLDFHRLFRNFFHSSPSLSHLFYFILFNLVYNTYIDVHTVRRFTQLWLARQYAYTDSMSFNFKLWNRRKNHKYKGKQAQATRASELNQSNVRRGWMWSLLDRK